MLKHASELGLCVAAIVVLSGLAWSQQQIAVEHAKTFTFDNKQKRQK